MSHTSGPVQVITEDNMCHRTQRVRPLAAPNAIAEFSSGELDLGAVQAQLQQALGPLESDGAGVADLVRGAEADVEEIRFTRLLEEQLPAVTCRLDNLYRELAERAVMDHHPAGTVSGWPGISPQLTLRWWSVLWLCA